MNLKSASTAITRYIAQNSQFDPFRSYLGMSKVGDCPRKVVRELRSGQTPTEETYRMSYAGYDQERSVLQMLIGSQLAVKVTRELVAEFDSRLRGHIDAETPFGELVEIKSLSSYKFQRVAETKRLHPRHYCQVQLYLRFGGYERALVVCRNRDTYEHMLFQVSYTALHAERFVQKAKMILSAYDSGSLPTCDCGHCK